MTVLGGIGFTAPWLLVALAALPILWLILRAVPPAPIRRRFPGVALLLGLNDADAVSDRTPWWLMLLRMLAVALVILGLAGPVMNPETERARISGPLLVVLDGTWAGAAHWPQMIETLQGELDRAATDDRAVAVLQLTRPEAPVFQAASTWPARLAGFQPAPWQPGDAQIDSAVALIAGAEATSAIWIGDGLAYDGQDRVLSALETLGPLSVIQSGQNVLGMTPATYADGAVQLSVARAASGPARAVTVLAQGRDPAGNPRVLATAQADFADGATEAQTELVLPAELRARVTRFEIQGGRSAGAMTLTDDSLRRREVALIAGRTDREGLELLSPLHYLQQALEPTADLIDGALADVLPANPDVIVLADVAGLTDSENADLSAWVENGGLLLRFAGPRVAASDVSRDTVDPLMPVRLRSGGRSVGGAMSWGEPKSLAPFRNSSPFFGLNIPEDVRVSAQVMAQPGPDLAEAVIADLSDGTPLVTRKRMGQGQVVLFHVTANAEWSTLPLSGLFVEMLERLAVSSAAATPEAADLQGTVWQPEQVMDGYGALRDAGTLPGIDGPRLVEAPLGPDMLPGIYASDDRYLARNVLSADAVLTPATWPARVPVTGFRAAPPEALGGLLMALALLLLAADVVASLALSGRLGPTRGAVAALAMMLMLPQGADAQDTEVQSAIEATSEVVLAHVLTGNAEIDEIAEAGLRGLSDTLFFRTSVEPAPPMGVNLETDDLAFFPILYWPITPDQPRPSSEAYARLNDYIRSGGLILFDTRDANIAGFGTASPNGRKLQDLAAPLDIPALEPVPGDHVLTRTFYLLQDFPGRHISRDVWVEAAPPGAEQVAGMPFRNLNDGVTPVVIGGNDWAGAWAVDTSGNPMLPVGRGFGGERQRELAYRFGINLVMHVLTGNYKSDQVHVPALLDRLGQ
ncbi:DUF4159 domain-containing protein [Pseudosulfitobacter koreensis]|uniref:DUF4159 domain-containing protein n=1 Tax=Pseudosulfitobacter koreensis TaxID=2968472 RepID=A0ABT1YWR3_9RHOB|nr:DUF4159 domain-containing protein [Pseudosulfitobacter koreense]MCR8825330.1 DUF4159 domain-containing protein [Pseudosulfitobacter koreense]